MTDGSANALTDIVTNSKGAFESIAGLFSDLTKSIIRDMIRIGIQAQITNAITGMFGGFGGGMAGAGAASSGASAGAMAMSASFRAYSSGGYTGNGDKYDPRGIVHAGEFVFTKEATDRIGVDNLYSMMNSGGTSVGSMTPDAYAMKNINTSNNTSNNSNQVVISNTFIIGGKEQTESSTHDTSNSASAIKNEVIKVVSEQIDKALKQSGKISTFVTNKIGRR